VPIAHDVFCSIEDRFPVSEATDLDRHSIHRVTSVPIEAAKLEQ
jgi:hypothetical protein